MEIKGESIVITPETTVWSLIEKDAGLRDYLPEINSKLSLIKGPLGPIVGKVASLSMVADKIDMPVDTLIDKIA